MNSNVHRYHFNIHTEQERGESSWIPRDRDAVCSKHFAIQEFKNDVRKKTLKEDVLPSVFCDYPEVLAPVYLKNLDQGCIILFCDRLYLPMPI